MRCEECSKLSERLDGMIERSRLRSTLQVAADKMYAASLKAVERFIDIGDPENGPILTSLAEGVEAYEQILTSQPSSRESSHD